MTTLNLISIQDIAKNPLVVIDQMISFFKPKQPFTGLLKGRTNNVKTAKGQKISTVFALVDIDQVIASHTATGAENPNYPQELQPRDRSRESSQAWVQKTANDLDPESLGRSGRADTGAPITGDDLVVESGNGRTMAIKLAYERGTADEYKQWLIDEADYFGFSSEQVQAIAQPILIRIRTTEIDRAQFAIDANQDDKLSFTATERAKADAKRLDENLLALFNPSEDGDLLAVSNQKFIQGFLSKLGDTEAAQYTTKDKKPTQALINRIKAAIFSKAYNDDRLLEMMADHTKPDLQNMLNALGVAAPKFIEAQAISRGNVQDISDQIVDGMEQAIDQRVANAIIDAANTILSAKHNDQDIVEFVKQQGLFEDLGEGVAELAVFLAKNSRSSKKMSMLFKALAEFAEKQALDGSNVGLFGEPEPVSVKDAIQYAQQVLGDDFISLQMYDSLIESSSSCRSKIIRLTREGAERFHNALKISVDLASGSDRTVMFNIDSNLKDVFLKSEIDKQAHNAATSPFNFLSEPTEEQKVSGDYQKGNLDIAGLRIAIENPAGSIRSGKDQEGNLWQVQMKHHYGYIEDTTGADGDELDVFIKNGLEHNPETVYIIRQQNKDGTFDEHKIIIGAENLEDAKNIYLANYEENWTGFAGIKQMTMERFKESLNHTWSEFDSILSQTPSNDSISDSPFEDIDHLFNPIDILHEDLTN
ncbi:hypothetical protein [Acinetobacter baumannii]|uniref:hypothetical protein n=1 Tax=Acinetobacter baumannii TaxID=470 RepID=UPI000345D1D9|nr:hypothetical protein [Acinetobacter baumannii]MBL4076612.1 hypothetical protein [Acinetobacter baumannii]MCA4325929.1 hypothetical protein [Acinetobacter baumannii]